MPNTDSTDRCNYRDTAGRRCRPPRKATHPEFCAHHARLCTQGAIPDPQALVAEVLGPARREDGGPSPDFRTAEAVNRTTGKLLETFLGGRIPLRHAAVAGYLCQLLIQTLPQLRIESTPEGGERVIYQFVSRVVGSDESENQAGTNQAGELNGGTESACVGRTDAK